MLSTVINRLNAWNDRSNGLPRKCMLIVLTLFSFALLLWLLPFFLPTAAAFLLSCLLEPVVRRAVSWLGGLRARWLHMRRGLVTVLCMLLLFGVAGWAAAALVNRLLQELIGFVKTLPQLIAAFTQQALPRARELYEDYRLLLPPYAPQMLENALSSLGDMLLRWAGSLSGALTSGAWSTATSIPNMLLTLVLTVMGTYYLTADRARITAFIRRTLPAGMRRRMGDIRAHLIRALLGQVRSQLAVSAIIIAFLVVCFALFGVRYGLLIGLLIGVADALPVVGAGLFLVPWSLLGFLTGDTLTGVLMACAYVGTVLIRQIVEPRIVGKNLGVYPLAAMAAMYAGYRLMGFLGLLAGPMLLALLKSVLDADEAARRDERIRI